MTEHPIIALSDRYSQLLLPIRKGMKDTEEYKNAVLRGVKPKDKPDFTYDPEDRLTEVSTPAGSVDVLFLKKRPDFEHAVHALAYKCEPVPIPASMGASAISGIINWKKIRDHLQAYLSEGGTDEDSEFSRFTSDKSNYLDSLIILSSGEYSAVPASEMGLPAGEWLDKSVTIRKFHELSHFYSRRLFPENREDIRDEIVADMIGIVAAFGKYDTDAARRFLGIEGSSYREGGRLQNYVENMDDFSVINRAKMMIYSLYENTLDADKSNIFELLEYIEKNKIATL